MPSGAPAAPGSLMISAVYDANILVSARFCESLFAAATIVVDPPWIPGAVPRDPNDDKVVACTVAAGVRYILPATTTFFRSAVTVGSQSPRLRNSSIW
ncbi:MAG: hypothetical protein JO110_10995 [Acetobacteraceae bacterium]|nr:hypothetical protein [Acetobacteraceae bacterium]